jgi:hypothetical protein
MPFPEQQCAAVVELEHNYIQKRVDFEKVENPVFVGKLCIS